MSRSLDYFLLYKYSFANRAVLTLGKTVLGTGSVFGFVNDLSMSRSLDCFLLYKHSFANRAMLTLGKTVLGTGSVFSFVDHFAMTGGRYFAGFAFSTLARALFASRFGTRSFCKCRPLSKRMYVFNTVVSSRDVAGVILGRIICTLRISYSLIF